MNPNYKNLISSLEAKSMMPKSAPSLKPMQNALKELSLTSTQLHPSKVTLVAGTNGKGSTASLLAHLLSSSGKKTGLYTSPHLIDTRERISVDGNYLDESSFLNAYSQLKSKVNLDVLSHFEILTLLAVYVFFELENVDHAVFEVGLGGTWDATNALEHETAVITRIGFDHMHILGNSIESILKNKLDIVQTGTKNCFHQKFPNETQTLVDHFKSTRRARFHELRPFDYSEKDAKIFFGGKTYSSPLWGKRGAENFCLAAQCFEAFGGSLDTIHDGLKTYRWPARLETARELKTNREVYFSCDHNVDGLKSLKEFFINTSKKVHLLVGIGDKKDSLGMAEVLNEFSDSSICLTTTPFQTQKIESYPRELRDLATECFQDPLEGLRFVIDHAPKEDLILVTGSIYLVGQLLKQTDHWLNKKLGLRKNNS